MKFYLSFLFVLFFSFILKAQCPVIEGAMVKVCGANEGLNEFVLFTTTSSATAGDYTLYYGDNSTPSLGLPVNILAGVNATMPNGSGSITTTNGCIINQVTAAATMIPANSRVLFIPSGFDANYDVSAICSSGNVYIVYIDITSVPSIWNAGGVFANTPPVTSYLQVTNAAALCASGIRSYNNNWVSDINGNSVWWDGTGNANNVNYGCSVIIPPVTISNFTALSVCAGSTATTASYTATGNPDKYTLLWDATASAAGFLDVINASLTGSPLTVAVPSGAAAATYTASLIVKNSLSGISSVAQNISLTIHPKVTPLFTAIAAICSSDTPPVLPATSTNGISGTWSPVTVSNTLSGTYIFTPAAGLCATGTSISVTVLPLPIVSVIGTTTICSGTSANIIFNGTPNATVTYNINGGPNQTIALNFFGFQISNTGNLSATTIYNLVSIATASCSQLQTGSATITVLAPVAGLSAGSAAVCSGTGTNIIFSGTPNAIVTFNINGGASQTTALDAAGRATVATGNITTATTYNLVSVATTGTLVCSKPATGAVTVTVIASPTVAISGSTAICPGTTSNIIFNGTPGAIVTYNVNGGVIQTVLLDAVGMATVATGNLTITAIYNLVSVATTGTLICLQPSTGTATVTVNALPTASINGTISICNGTATNIVFSGTPNASVTYNINGGTNQNIQLDIAGVAIVNTGNLLVTTQYNLVSVTSMGIPACSQNITGQVIVTVKPITATPTVTNSVTLCQYEIATPLTATGSNLSWYTLPAGGAGVSIAPIPVTTVGALTDYYVTQTINSCESQRVSITVTVNPEPVIPSVPMIAVYRCGPGPVTLNATAPGMVKWYSDAALTQFILAGTSYSPSINVTTTFYVNNTEGNCVSPMRSITAIVFPSVTQVTGFNYSPSVVCAGSAKPVPVLVSGFILGGVYSSTAGLSFNSITGVINPSLSTPGTYVVKYTLGAAICAAAGSSTTTITITKSTIPVTAFSYPSPVCTSAVNPLPVPSAGFINGGSFSSATGLSINAATGVIDLKSSTAGTYTVNYTLAATACTTSGSSNADITINAAQPATGTNGVQRCGNGVVILNASGTGIVKWYSDAGLTNLLLQGNSYSPAINATTTFYVTNTAGNCISSVTNITATVLPITTPVTNFNYNPSTACAGSTNMVAIPAAGFGQGGVYSSATGISLNSSTGDINPATSTPGTYVVKYILSASGCALAGSSTTNITISKSIATVTAFSYAFPVCKSAANPLPLLSAGFSTGGSFSSSTGLSINAITGVIDIATSIAGTYTITYAVTATPCTTGGSSKADITITAPPTAPVASNSQRCGNGVITLNATGTGIIKWYADAGLSNLLTQGNTYEPTISATTNFYVTSNIANCVSPVANMTATVIPMTIQVTDFSYSPSTVCAGSANPVPIPVAGFVQGGVYSSAGGLSLNSATGIIDPSTSTPGTYVVKYSLPASVCTFAGNNTATIIISKPVTTVTTFSYASPVCTSGENPLPLKATGFTTDGIFSSSTGLSINATTGGIDLTASVAGKYTVTYTVTATPCTTADSSKADITISSSLAAPVTKSSQRCGSGELTLNATSSSTLNWYDGPGLKSIIATGPSYKPFANATTDYYVTSASGNCESVASLVTATILPIPVKPDLGKNNTLCPGDKLVLQPGIYDNYLWQDNSTSPTFTVSSAGKYSLLVKSANGCSNAASISITPSNICADILFPTAFSPNGDQLNDNFGPLPVRNLAYVKNYTLRIFNRYGQVVFKSTNAYEKWDGMYLGQLFDTGSFMWQAEYIYNNGNIKSQKGYVTIVH